MLVELFYFVVVWVYFDLVGGVEVVVVVWVVVFGGVCLGVLWVGVVGVDDDGVGFGVEVGVLLGSVVVVVL